TPLQFAVICYDRNTGKELWRKVAVEKIPHEGTHGTNTYASASPITDGKRVFAFFGSRGIHAYDMDGKLLWQRDLGAMKVKMGFGEGASPALHGDTLVVPWDHEDGSLLFALDAKTGDILWKKERDEATTWATPLIIERPTRTQVVVNG